MESIEIAKEYEVYLATDKLNDYIEFSKPILDSCSIINRMN